MLIANMEFVHTVRLLLSSGHKVRFHVRGRSMYPILKGGRDQVILESAKNIKEKDLVLAQVRSGYYVLHRVIRKDGDQLTLMGDGNLTITEECSCSNVVGKVEMVLINGRWIRTDGFGFRIYSAVWIQLIPLKKILFIFCRFINRYR